MGFLTADIRVVWVELKQEKRDGCGVSYGDDTSCTLWHHSRLTGDIQVGVGVDLSSLVAGEALEDAGVLRPQRVDAQPPAQQHLVPGVLQPAEGN